MAGKPRRLWYAGTNAPPQGPAANQDHLWSEAQIKSMSGAERRKLLARRKRHR